MAGLARIQLVDRSACVCTYVGRHVCMSSGPSGFPQARKSPKMQMNGRAGIVDVVLSVGVVNLTWIMLFFEPKGAVLLCCPGSAGIDRDFSSIAVAPLVPVAPTNTRL